MLGLNITKTTVVKDVSKKVEEETWNQLALFDSSEDGDPTFVPLNQVGYDVKVGQRVRKNAEDCKDRKETRIRMMNFLSKLWDSKNYKVKPLAVYLVVKKATK